MLDTTTLRENYSGVVKLRLRVGEREFELAKLGPGYIVFRQPVKLPPCRGEVIMTIDDREHRWDVELADGVSPDQITVVEISR